MLPTTWPQDMEKGEEEPAGDPGSAGGDGAFGCTGRCMAQAQNNWHSKPWQAQAQWWVINIREWRGLGGAVGGLG